MKRKKKPEETTATATRRKPGRTRQAQEKPKENAEEAVVVTDDEKALVAKYGHTHKIVAGSLRYAGGREGWGHKRTVEIRCAVCEATRILASSDLHFTTTKYCHTHARDAKRTKKAAKKTKQELT